MKYPTYRVKRAWSAILERFTLILQRKMKKFSDWEYVTSLEDLGEVQGEIANDKERNFGIEEIVWEEK